MMIGGKDTFKRPVDAARGASLEGQSYGPTEGGREELSPYRDAPHAKRDIFERLKNQM